jgi:hypothetical protein
VYAGATGALKLAMGMPMDAWEKLQHKQVKLAEAVEGYEEHEGHEPQPMVLSARVGGLASRLMS